MIKSIKYRLYPTEEQQILIKKHIGCSRMIYNLALELKTWTYRDFGKNITYNEMSYQLTELKKEFPFLEEVSAQVLQQSLKNLDSAFTNFFRKNAKYPTFKSSKKSRQSCRFPQSCKLSEDNKKLELPKFREGIPIVLHKTIDGIIKNVTLSITSTGKYFASICYETDEQLPKKKDIKESTTIGVDLGFKELAVTSNNMRFENPKYFDQYLPKLKKYQRKLSKQKKGSNNSKLTKLKIAKIYEKITNKNEYYLHKVSHEIINLGDTICFEDLSVIGMQKSRFGKSLQNVALGKFQQMCKYKADWNGKNYLEIGRFEPSSKMCKCGSINKELKLSERNWKCSNCGSINDRDLLAANNIKMFALRNYQLNLEYPEKFKKSGLLESKEDVELPTLVGVMKHQK